MSHKDCPYFEKNCPTTKTLRFLLSKYTYKSSRIYSAIDKGIDFLEEKLCTRKKHEKCPTYICLHKILNVAE